MYSVYRDTDTYLGTRHAYVSPVPMYAYKPVLQVNSAVLPVAPEAAAAPSTRPNMAALRVGQGMGLHTGDAVQVLVAWHVAAMDPDSE